MSNLIKVDHEQYGLEETKAADISKMFVPMLEEMVNLEKEFNELQKLPFTKDVCKQAKTLRLKYVKVRTGTSAIHKELKSFYLKGGRFVDGWKNAQLMASQGIEEKLSTIEKYYENIEKEKIKELQIERESQLEQYEVEVIPLNLGDMDVSIWNSFLIGTIQTFEAKKEAEKKEALRLEQERIEEENRIEAKRLEDIAKEKERKKLQAENDKLKKAAAKKEEARLEEKRLLLVEKAKAAAAPDKAKLLQFAEVIKSEFKKPKLSTKEGNIIMANIEKLLIKVNSYILIEANKL